MVNRSVAVPTILPLLLLLVSSNAYAFDGDFYTYEGFSPVLNTFKVIALIFHDHQFKVLVGLFATIGVFSSGFISFMRAVFGNGQNVQSAIGWLFWPIVGCAVYQALVLPKGTIHIYDKVSNQYQAVSHVPRLLVALSTVFNSIEEGLRKIVSTNTASPHAKDINDVSLKLFYDTMMGASDGISIHYAKSIRRFYDDCMPISNAIEPKFDLNRLLKVTPNIFDELQHLWHPSIFTIFYGENRRGTTLCCTDAWNKLSTWINHPGNFQDNFVHICKKHGFSDPKQFPACKKEIAKGASFVFGHSVNSDALLRNAIFAQNIAKLLTDRNPDRQVGAYSTRKMINSGLASATVSNLWTPAARGVVTAVILAVMPFLLMLLVTPLMPKVLALIFSLFAWLTMWGVCDAILHQATIDQMISVFEDHRAFKMGLWALWTSPTAAVKALAILGHARANAGQLAGVIGAAVLGFSFHGMSSLSGSVTGRIEQAGAEAADRTLEPEKAADYMGSIANANATFNTIRQQGWGAFQGARTLEESQRSIRAQTMTGGLGNYSATGQTAGIIEGAEWRGKADALSSNGQNLEATTYQTTHTETSQRVGDAQGIATAAEGLEQGVQKMQQGISEIEMHQRHARATVAQEINQQIAENNPENSTAENWHQQSLLTGGSQTKAMGEAVNWKINTLQDVLTAQTQGNFATTQAQQQVAKESDRDYPGFMRDLAKWNALNQAGKNLAMEKAAERFDMSHQEFANSVGRGGTINNLVLSGEHLKALNAKNPLMVSDDIVNMYPDGAVLNGAISCNGTLIQSSWTANTSASKTTTIDNSVYLGNAASARSTLANVDQVKPLIAHKGLEPLYEASAKSLQPILHSSHSNSLSKNLQGGGSINFDKIPWLKLSAGGSINKQWGDQTVTDVLYGNFSAFGKALEHQADQQNLQGNDRLNFLANHYANINQEVQQHVDLAARTGSHGSSVENPFEQYLKSQKLEEAQKVFKKGIPGGDKGDGQ